MAMGILEHYQQHKTLGTPSTKDGMPILLPKLSQSDIDSLDDLEGPDGGPFLKSGMILYNTTTDTVQVYDGNSWNSL